MESRDFVFDMENQLENVNTESEGSSAASLSCSADENELKMGAFFYIQKIKLAVAIAIIRLTPSDMTPEQYARKLVQEHCENVQSWKKKCQSLEQHILGLEQSLCTATLKAKTKVDELGIDITKEDCSSPQPLIPYTPNPNAKSKILSTMDFVRSFIILGSFSSDLRHDDAFEQMRSTLLRSASALLEYLISEEGLETELKIINQAIREVHKLLDSRLYNFDEELTEICICFVEKLLVAINKTLEINKTDQQHRRSTLIQLIAKHRFLKVPVFCRLLREISIAADFFEGLFRDENENLEPLLHFENTYFFLQATEGIASDLTPADSFRIPESAMEMWDTAIEKSLTALGTLFPLFCVYVWHIKSLIKGVINLPSEN